MKKTSYSIGLLGLGRLGAQIARTLHREKFNIIAWNRSPAPRKAFKKFGGKTAETIDQLIAKLSGKKVIWLMLPAGRLIDQIIFGPDGLAKQLSRGDIIIDGGNSFFRDSIKRAQKLQKYGIHYFDCGTSGGVHGEKNGFSLMIGGSKRIWPQIETIFKTLATGQNPPKKVTNYGLVGPNGAGHFVKMVHNGIEYGMMESIAEGFAVMNKSQFSKDLNLSQVSQIWGRGAVITSWLIDLAKNIFDTEKIDSVVGDIQSTGEGEWTIREAKRLGVDVSAISVAFKIRQRSKQSKEQKKFSNKIVALLRKQFGGHEVKYKK